MTFQSSKADIQVTEEAVYKKQSIVAGNIPVLDTDGKMIDSGINVTNQSLSPLGVIIADDFNRASIGVNWSQVGSQFSIVSNKLRATGGTPGSAVLTNYLVYDAYGICNLSSWTKTFDITVGAISATSWGIACGVIGAGTMVNGVQVGIALDSTNLGKISYYRDRHPTNGLDVSPNGMSITAGDVLRVTVRWNKNKFTTSVYNVNTGFTNTYEKIYFFYNNATYVTPIGAYKFAFFSMGGTHDIDNLEVHGDDFVGVDLEAVGDSITSGFSIDNRANSWTDYITNSTNWVVQTNSSEGNKIDDINTNEIIALAPKRILLLIGFNNAQVPDSVATFQAKYDALVATLVSAGYVVGTTLLIGLLTPSSATANLTSNIPLYNASLISTFSNDALVDFNTPLKDAAGTGLRTGYTIDLYHPSITAQRIMADVVMDFFKIQYDKFRRNNYYPLLPSRNGKYLATNVENKRATLPTGIFEFWGTGQDAQVGIGNTGGSSAGAYWASQGISNGEFLAGCYYNGSNYTAVTTKSIRIQLNFGIITFAFADTVAGVAFNFTNLISIDPTNGLSLGTTPFKRSTTTIAGTSQAGAVNNIYQPNNVALTTIALPAVSAVGDTMEVVGNGAGGWKISQAAGQIIHHLTDTTAGVGGSVASSSRYDTITLRCCVANLEWNVMTYKGTLVVV